MHTYLFEEGIHNAECSRSPNAGTAVHHRRPLVLVQDATLSNRVEELQEDLGVARHAKIGPLGVVEVQDLPGVLSLSQQRDHMSRKLV